MKNKIILITLITLASCSTPITKKVIEPIVVEEVVISKNPALDKALASPSRMSELVQDVNYIKGFNTNSCINNMWQDRNIPLPMRILGCSCMEEVKEELLKEKYTEDSSVYKNVYVEGLCLSVSATYLTNPALVKEIVKENMTVFADEVPLFLLRDESSLDDPSISDRIGEQSSEDLE